MEREPVRHRPSTLLANRFRLRTPLAHGGMGELWIADHLGLGTEVVVKFISAQLSDRPGAAERFAREAAAAAQVNSPHVVKILDYGASPDGAPFIVMEKLEGRDLASYLAERGSLPPDSVARIVRQLAKALTKAHAARIVHRDIKPANVFVCEAEGELFVKLLDFGVAKRDAPDSAAATMSGVCVGTPGYMSPEQIVASKHLDFRADLWSLGVLAFHCLTGRKPFDGETAGAVLLAIHTLPLPKPSRCAPTLPAAVDPWFERACARDAENRFESATDMANALATALDASDGESAQGAARSTPGEPLTVEAEEAPPAQPASTLSTLAPLAPAPAKDDSLLQSSIIRAPRSGPRRSAFALLVTMSPPVALGGTAYAGSKGHAPQNVESTPASHGDVGLPPRVDVQPPPEREAPVFPPAAERVLESPNRHPPARNPQPRAHHPAPSAAAESAAAPTLVSGATAPATSALPSPPPAVSSEVDPSRLYVMPDARR